MAVKEFMAETEKLVNERTVKSKGNYRGLALSGAIREQKQKWDAIASRTNKIQKEEFYVALHNHAKEISAEFIRFEAAKVSKEGRGAKENGAAPVDGRSLATEAMKMPSLHRGVPMDFAPHVCYPSGCAGPKENLDVLLTNPDNSPKCSG